MNENTPEKVSVNYDPIKGMIALGNYQKQNSKINSENFPISILKPNTELLLVDLNKKVKPKDALAYLEENGMRPATLIELLAFGTAAPVTEEDYTVVALGSSCSIEGVELIPLIYFDHSISPCIYSGNLSHRCIGLQWIGHTLKLNCRFLAAKA